MRHWIEPNDKIYVKGYGFFSSPKNMGTHLSNKYGQKLSASATKSAADAIKTDSKRAIQKTAEATGDFTGNKIADKITIISGWSSRELQNNDANDEIEVPKERYVSPEKRQQIIDELRLV